MDGFTDFVRVVGHQLTAIGADPMLAGAAVLGALAVVLDALVGPVLVATLAHANEYGVVPPDWLVVVTPSVVLAAALGVLQAAVRSPLGGVAATALGLLIGGSSMFVLWRCPKLLLHFLRWGTKCPSSSHPTTERRWCWASFSPSR